MTALQNNLNGNYGGGQGRPASQPVPFPTIQEQVELCRRIAGQLVDEENARSKGASMFFKRVRRAPSWEVRPHSALSVDTQVTPTPQQMQGDADESELRQRLKQQLLSPGGTPISRVMDPRGRLVSLQTLKNSAEHVQVIY